MCVIDDAIIIITRLVLFLRNVMLVTPEKATTIVLAIMTLHNYLCSDNHYIHAVAVDDELLLTMQA